MKPVVASPVQDPAGRLYVCVSDVPLLIWMVSVAPLATGSPTIASSLPASFALTLIFRCSGAPGFFTTNLLPSTV